MIRSPMIRSMTAAAGLAALAATAACADGAAFHPGPAIAEFGMIADVPGAAPLPDDAAFKIAFDVSDPAEAGAASRRLESAARFINMHVAAGVDPENIDLAIVVHGRAVRDVITSARRQELEETDNASADLVAALIDAGVRIEVCGQSAAYYDVRTEDLLPGVVMQLSAMTAHALLQQDGYTLNPF